MRQFIFAAAVLVAGCGNGAGPDLACDLVDKSGDARLHQCNELFNLDPTQRADAEGACPKLGGVIVDTCPVAGQLGVCQLSFDGLTEDLHFYAESDTPGMTRESSCKQLKGTWKAN